MLKCPVPVKEIDVPSYYRSIIRGDTILIAASNSILKHNTGGGKFLGNLRHNLYDNNKMYVKMHTWRGFIWIRIWAKEGLLRTR
jgi:hypothetical protein